MTYKEVANTYMRTGLGMPIPLFGKVPPPGEAGLTGGSGVVTEKTVRTMIERYPTANTGLRLDATVIGIDVDDYTKPDGTVKTGLKTLAEWQDKHGVTLPPTIRSSSRGPANLSGIRYYRIIPEEGARLRGSLGPDVEIIWHGYRYAAVWPSIHPDTKQQYQWIDTFGRTLKVPPMADELPDLPEVAFRALMTPRLQLNRDVATEGLAEVLAKAADGPACTAVQRFSAKVQAHDHIGHGNAPALVYQGVRLALEGHRGVPDVMLDLLERLRAYLEQDRPERQPKEYVELVRDQTAAAQQHPVESTCRCRAASSPGSPADAEGGGKVDGLPHHPAFAALSERARERAAVIIATDDAKSAIRRWRDPVPPLHERLVPVNRIDDLPTIEPLIEGLLGSGELGMLVGESNLGKTAFAMHMGLAVATGSRMLGRYTTQTKTLYISGEGQRGLSARVRATREAWGYDPGDEHFQLLPDVVDLSDGEAAKELAELTNAEGFGFVILDTLAATMGEFVENDATSMGLYLSRAKALVRAVDGTVLILHHVGKASGSGIRGSSALRGRADTVLVMNGESGRWTLAHDKRRDGGKGTIGAFRTKPAHGSVIVEGVAPPFPEPFDTSEPERNALLSEIHLADPPVLAPTGLHDVERIFNELAAQNGGVVDSKRWMAACQEAGVPRSTAYDRRKVLIEHRRIVQRKDGLRRVS